MTNDEEARDQRLLDEIALLANDYGALHRRTVRDLARTRADLAASHTVLGSVAHDLRNPLAAVVGFAELLLDDQALTPEQRRLGEQVHRAASTMTILTEELVEAVTAGASPLQFERVNLSLVIGHVVARHQLLRPPRGVRVVMSTGIADGAPTIVQGDEAKLERLLDNLISNAVKFSPDHGDVRVGVTDDTRTAEIRVQDDGPGIPAGQQEAIFAPFHREPGAASVPGVGLGLTIVKQLTERHGGRVHVESVLGAGATFVVRLPLLIRSATGVELTTLEPPGDSQTEPAA